MLNDLTSSANRWAGEFYIPKVLPVQFQTVPLLYRWCFSSEELFAGGPLRDIRASVQFKMPKKLLSIREFRHIVGKTGWLSVGLLTVENPKPSQYLLTSCFIEFDRRIAFLVIEALFDHVESIEPLEAVPEDVIYRSQIDYDHHEQVSLAHWSKITKIDFRSEMDTLENLSAESVLQLQQQIDQLSEIIRAKRLSEDGDFLSTCPTSDNSVTGEDHIQELMAKRQDLRSMLTDEESSAGEKIRMLIEASNSPPTISKRNLFTIRWRVTVESSQ